MVIEGGGGRTSNPAVVVAPRPRVYTYRVDATTPERAAVQSPGNTSEREIPPPVGAWQQSRRPAARDRSLCRASSAGPAADCGETEPSLSTRGSPTREIKRDYRPTWCMRRARKSPTPIARGRATRTSRSSPPVASRMHGHGRVQGGYGRN